MRWLLVVTSMLAGCASARSGSASATVVNSPVPAPIIIVIQSQQATASIAAQSSEPTIPTSERLIDEPELNRVDVVPEVTPRREALPTQSSAGTWNVLRAVCESGSDGSAQLSALYTSKYIFASGTVTRLSEKVYGFLSPDDDTLRCSDGTLDESDIGRSLTVSGAISQESACGEAAVFLTLLDCHVERATARL